MKEFEVVRTWRRAAAWFGVLSLGGLIAGGCSPPANRPAGANSTTTKVVHKVDIEAVRPQVEAFCGDCHAVPPASSFSKADWAKEVERGFEFYYDSGRTDLVEPPLRDVIAYFEAQAPQELEYPEPKESERPFAARFRPQHLPRPSDHTMDAVSTILWNGPQGSAPGQLLFTDMSHGDMATMRFGAALGIQALGVLKHPASLDPADLDGDGRTDYLVAELGTFLPKDHDLGRVVWLRLEEKTGWTSHVLLEGVGRISQAVDGDFDGDGDIDVLAAEFGWLSTGKIHLLRRTGDAEGVPQFEDEIVDGRHGTTHVRPLDWEGDGDLDFVAMITQEHEKVELFLNDGQGKFRIETIHAAGDPAFGSSGIELVDLDSDGDMDVLYTNGDSLDSMIPKPYHGVRWLENRGKFPFEHRELAIMPGVYKAVAADLDGDGDLDVAAVAFPGEGSQFREASRNNQIPPLDLMIVLEQTDKGRFVRHRIDSPDEGLALAAGDFDNDGDVDLATGAFGRTPSKGWLTIWWNETLNLPESAAGR